MSPSRSFAFELVLTVTCTRPTTVLATSIPSPSPLLPCFVQRDEVWTGIEFIDCQICCVALKISRHVGGDISLEFHPAGRLVFSN